MITEMFCTNKFKGLMMKVLLERGEDGIEERYLSNIFTMIKIEIFIF